MIIRDENGRAVSAESLSDITKEINEIEAIFSRAIENKKNGGSMPADEKDALNKRMEDLKVLMDDVKSVLQKKARTVEIMAFVKALTKLKKLADSDFSELKND